jgi:hypothetical protein
MIPPLAAILVFPLVAWVLFSVNRLPVALLAVVLTGYLLLPERTALDLPILPALDKQSVPALAALIFALAHRHQPADARPFWLPQSWIGRSLIFLLLFGSFATVMTNADPVGPRPGLGPYDALSDIQTMLLMLLPMLLARKYLGSADGHRILLVALCIAGLCYSLLALYEVRMSPQLNLTLYGFFPHNWLQHIRGGGFRPLVFLQHGLWLAIFMCCTVIAAFGAMRAFPGRRIQFLVAGLWLLATLFLSNSLGALVIALLVLPAVIFVPPRVQTILGAALATAIIVYPALRGGGWVPITAISQWAYNYSPERGESLEFRLNNEDVLLTKAQERPLFGWGGWGRSRTYDEEGRTFDITDGYWIIIIGVGGWVRYLGEFGLFAWPLLSLARHSRKVGIETSVLGLVLAANLVDLIPNATVTPITWLLAGSLWGYCEVIQRSGAAAAGPQPQPLAAGAGDAEIAGSGADRGRTAYTRQSRLIHRTRPTSR